MTIQNGRPYTRDSGDCDDTQAPLNEQYQRLAQHEHLLPIKVTSFYRKKVAEEVAALGHTEGPLHRCVYPTWERLRLRAPNEVADFVEDRWNMPPGLSDVVIHKYEDRLLFLPTDICAAHCQYCFRQDVLAELHTVTAALRAAALETKLDALLAYLRGHPTVSEVILSGGDPLTLSYDRLDRILSRLRDESSVASIRVHTRTLSFAPKVFTPRMAQLLGRTQVRLVAHVVHPYEVCEVVRNAVALLQSEGVRCYNQFPLLRKINDHPLVLERHLRQLDDLGIRNLSMFIPDPINYSACFRIRLRRLFTILDALNWHTPAWINSTRVVLDTPYGKVRREDLKGYDDTQNCAIFERDGREIVFHDFPQELDEPGDIATLLWKG